MRANQIIATTFTVRAAADLVEKTQQRLLDDGNIVAAEEILGIHVDQTSGRATVLPEATRASAVEHTVPAPAWVGRSVAI